MGGAGAPTFSTWWCRHLGETQLSSNGSYTGELFGRRAAAAGVGVEQWLVQWAEDVTLLGRLPTLAQVADAAVFLASDRAAAITGAVVDLTCGNAMRNTARALVGVLD